MARYSLKYLLRITALFALLFIVIQMAIRRGRGLSAGLIEVIVALLVWYVVQDWTEHASGKTK
jgi:hypothetical protein